MAKRGTLYRCTLCSGLFGGPGPQTENALSLWTQDLEPVGGRKLLSGERVELSVTLTDSPFPITEDSAIRFDILEEDFLLTGGADDRVGSILCGVAEPSGEAFPLLGSRDVRAWSLPVRQTVAEAVAEFIEGNPLDYADYLLVLRDPVADETYSLVTWWRESFLDDAAGGSEFYFIVNVDEVFEDQSEPVLNVTREPAPLPPPAIASEAIEQEADRLMDDSSFVLAFDIDDPDEGDVPGTEESTTAFQKALRALYDSLPAAVTDDEATEDGPSASAALAGPGAAGGSAVAPSGPPVGPAPGAQPIPVAAPGTASAGSGVLPPPVAAWPYVHPERYRAAHQLPNSEVVDLRQHGKSPFDGRVIGRVEPGVDVQVRSPAVLYYEVFELGRAVTWGRLQFGFGNYIILEGPLVFMSDIGLELAADRQPRYYVLPLETKISDNALSKQPVAPTSDQYYVYDEYGYRTYHFFSFDKTSGGYAVRRFFSAEAEHEGQVHEELYYPGFSPFLDETQRQASAITPLSSDDAVTPVFMTAAFIDIQTARSEENHEQAIELLGAISRIGFAALSRDQRHDYAAYLVSKLPALPEIPWVLRTDAVLHALTEIICAVADRGTVEAFREVEDIRKLLDPPPGGTIVENMADRFIRLMDSGLWDMLDLIGRRSAALQPGLSVALAVTTPETPPLELQEFFALLCDQLSLRSSQDLLRLLARLKWTQAGLELSSELVADVAAALHNLLRFLRDFVVGVAHLLTHPVELLKAIAMLLELIAKIMFAALPLPTALSVEGIVDGFLPYLNDEANWKQIPGFVVQMSRDDAIAFVRGNTPDDILKYLDNPPKLDKQLFELAKQFHEQCRVEIRELIKQTRDKFANGYAGAQQFRVKKEVLRQILWRAVWEIASLFVGAGEIKALAGGSKALIVSAVGLARLGDVGKIALRAEETEKVLALARLLSHESKAGDAAAYARALTHLPENEVRDVAKAMGELKQVDESRTVQEVAAVNADAPAVKTVVAAGDKAEAYLLIERKLGAAPPADIVAALEALGTEGRLSPAQLKELCQVLPDSEVARFFGVVGKMKGINFHGLAEFTPEFYIGVARSPRSLAMFERGEAGAANHLTLVSDGTIDWAKTERRVEAYETELGRLRKTDEAEALKLIQQVEDGKIERVKTLAGETGQPVAPRPPRPARPPRTPLPPGHTEVRDLFGSLDDAAYSELFPRPATGEPLTDVFDLLTDAGRLEIDVLAAQNKATLRRLVTELRKKTYDSRKSTLLRRIRKLKDGPRRADDLGKALDTLNGAFTKAIERDLATSGLTPEKIAGSFSESSLKDAVGVRQREMRQRAADFRKTAASADADLEKATKEFQKRLLRQEKANAEKGAADLEQQIPALEKWAEDPARAKDLADLRESVKGSTMLKDRLRNGGEAALQRLMCDMLFSSAAEGKEKVVRSMATDFERYVASRMSHMRGYSGEMDLAFRLGKGEFVIFKAPDPFVTRTGTDLVAGQRYYLPTEDKDRVVEKLRTLVFDNKSTRKLTEDKVSALLKNLADNLADDARLFEEMAAAGGEEAAAFRTSAENLGKASTEIAKAMERFGGATGDPAQNAIARILKRHDIHLVVTNEGGQTIDVAERLKKSITFWNPGTTALPPVPLPRGARLKK